MVTDYGAGRAPREMTVSLGGLQFPLVTRPGFPDWDHVSRAEMLLAEHADIADGERVLIWPAGNGALGLWAAEKAKASEVILGDTNYVALEAARLNASLAPRSEIRVATGLPGEVTSEADVVLLKLPKGRRLARLAFLSAFGALRPGGRLYLAGANDEGIKTAISDCALLYGEAQILAYKGGNRIALFSRRENLPVPLPAAYGEPGIAEGTWHEVSLECPNGRQLLFHSRPGIFSWRGIDEGTRLLLSVLRLGPEERVLDVGCGYGVIGAWAAARAPEVQVSMVDVDWLAVCAARENVALNGLTGVRVFFGDGTASAGDDFSLVVSNPPFHSGKRTDHDQAAAFVRGARKVLRGKGRLVLVANRFLPYDRVMRESFRQVEVLAETSRFWVLAAR